MRIAIIGGTGSFGAWYAWWFKQKGFQVTVTGRDAAKGKRVAGALGVQFTTDHGEAASGADVTIISTPISVVPEMIRSLAPKIPGGALLADFASVKKGACAAYRKLKKKDIEVASIHPMHGPREESVAGWPVVFIPIKPGKRYAALKRLFLKEKASVIECAWEEHDRVLSVVQGVTYFTALAGAAAVKKMGVGLSKTKQFGSPTYELLLELVSRVVCQNPELSAQILAENPLNKRARNTFLNEAKKMAEIIDKGAGEARRRIDGLAGFFCEVEK